MAGKAPPILLLSEVQACDDRSVTLDVLLFEIVEQATALTDHFQQASARVMILLVEFEVLIEVVDALGEQRDLNLGRTGVTLVQGIRFDEFLFGLGYVPPFFLVSPRTEYGVGVSRNYVSG